MIAWLLNVQSVVRCPHGGEAVLVTRNTTLRLPDALCLVEDDVFAVVGCPFVLPGPTPSPCVKVTWKGGSATVRVDGAAVLTTDSVGLCESAAGAPQGVAVVASHQRVVADG